MHSSPDCTMRAVLPPMPALDCLFLQVNHLPGTWELGRKDRLYSSLAAALRATGDPAFAIVPPFFILPRDHSEWMRDVAARPDQLYIQKVGGALVPSSRLTPKKMSFRTVAGSQDNGQWVGRSG